MIPRTGGCPAHVEADHRLLVLVGLPAAVAGGGVPHDTTGRPRENGTAAAKAGDGGQAAVALHEESLDVIKFLPELNSTKLGAGGEEGSRIKGGLSPHVGYKVQLEVERG